MKKLVTAVTVITDCGGKDDFNALGRVQRRCIELFQAPVIGLPILVETSQLERGSEQAVLELIDQIDAGRLPNKRPKKHQALILVNSATRGQTELHRPNGSPFCWWKPDAHTLVVSTMDGPVLPRANSLGLVPGGVVNELDIPTVLAHGVNQGWLTRPEAQRICDSQFRSFEFQPLVAHWLLRGRSIPSIPFSVGEYRPGDVTVLDDDSFGNLKLNITPEEFGYEEGREVTLANDTTAICVRHLKDVPQGDDEPILALTVGSSGLRDPRTGQETRFMELVVMQDSARKITGFGRGDAAILAKHVPTYQEL